ncbi:MAG TPA: biotin/lipoyl-containing protein, partial [Gemmataceae bacterium]|nr:biotin/lipoyl-containing protein [Gemmataceae bacterium]
RGGAQPVMMQTQIPMATAPMAVPSSHSATAAPASAPSVAAPAKSNLHEIKSDTVGVFYLQSKPGDPPFVKVGDRVTPDKQVGVIMVMKTHNEVLANCTGIIREICVTNDEAIEFGQVLFRVEPN